MDQKELLTLTVIFLVFFALAFTAISWYNSQNANLLGFKVTASEKPLPAIKSVLEKNRSLILRQQLTNETSRANSAIAAASAELVFAAYSGGITVHNYAAIGDEVMRETCNVNNSQCGAPDITLAVDSNCNCIKVFENRTMLITGSEDFLLNHAIDLRKIIFAARAYNASQQG